MRQATLRSVAAIAILGVAPPITWAEVVFAPAVSYPLPLDDSTDDTVRALVAGDWDRDGDLDLAVSSGTIKKAPSVVWVFLNNGDGTFASPLPHPAGNAIIALATGDLDGDGYLDIVAANNERIFNSVTVLLNNGNDESGIWLGFSPPTDYSSGEGQEGQNAITIGDLSGDGHLDIATANRNLGTVSILVNSGNGTFGIPILLDVAPLPQGIVAADLDDTVGLDLVTANIDTGPGSVSVLLAEAAMTFAQPMNYPVGGSPTSVVSGDWDEDDDLDLAVANSQNDGVTVLWNDGRGGFDEQSSFGSGTLRDVKRQLLLPTNDNKKSPVGVHRKFSGRSGAAQPQRGAR